MGKKITACFEKTNLALTTCRRARQFIKRQDNPGLISRVQNEKLQKLISYCYENIKYYRELFDRHRIRPDDIKLAADLVKVPVLTKEQLRNRFWDFLPKELPHCRVSRTSGSTGIPVCILSDVNSRINNSAAVIRCRKALGMHFFGGPILTPLKNENEPPKQPHWTGLQGIHKTFYINPYSSKDSDIEYTIKTIDRLHKPAVIGITAAVGALARRIREGCFPELRPSAVLTTGELLSEQARGLMENIFRVKVTDIYACNEAGDIAWQCKKGRLYHINADNCIVEILINGKPAEKGRAGEVVITNLNRYSMPFIRYKNGDLARFGFEDCRCGCKLPVISEIIGRTGEDIHLPDGKIIPWNQLKGFMNHPDIRQFQLIQNKNGSLTVRFIPENKSNIELTKNILTSRFEALLGNSIGIDFSIVEKIAPDPSGKSRLVICRYEPPDRIFSSS
jgi:phenylacetate-CoA ligase